jgi:hypothetical protein
VAMVGGASRGVKRSGGAGKRVIRAQPDGGATVEYSRRCLVQTPR